MTEHLDRVTGLLASTRIFYTANLVAERGAYALEWVNAFSHLDADERQGHLPHGGTLAQLHLGPLQRLSRDVDLLAKERGPIEETLDSIASRYERRLFTWAEDQIEAGPVPVRRFSVFFPSAYRRDELVPLKLDVSYLPVDLPTTSLALSASAVYVPRNTSDEVTTLTVEAFIADKLPTLGFDSHGYARPVEMAEAGNPEHIWKQIHDIGGLSTLGPDLAVTLDLYEKSIAARNTARNTRHSPAHCLLDAQRVCRIAFGAWAYPNDTDVEGDEDHAIDVQHVHAGLGAFGSYVRAGAPSVLLSVARTSLLVSGLRALSAEEITAHNLAALMSRCRKVADGVGRVGTDATRERLRTFLGRRISPAGWPWPVSSRQVFGSSPGAALYAFVSERLDEEAAAVSSGGRLSFEAD